MKHRNFLRSALALLLVAASLMGMLPMAFAAEDADRQEVTISSEELLAEMEQGQAQAEEDALVEQLCQQYGIADEEPEDSEFGYLTDEEMAMAGLETKTATKDVRNDSNYAYIFLNFGVGDASRGWNWQVKSDSSKDLYYATYPYGAIAGYYQGSDARLYMPVETDDSYITSRLNKYVLKAGDIARVYVSGITANSQFVSGNSETVLSYFGIHASGSVGAWQTFGSNRPLSLNPVAQTLTWNISSSCVGQTLYGIRWDPSQTELTEATRMYVDYIYVGPEATAPRNVQFRTEGNAGNMSYGNRYVGYGKKAPAFSTGKVNSETGTTATIWGWAVHQDTNSDGVYENMEKFITDPSTFTVYHNTRFVLTSVTVPKKNIASTRIASTGNQIYDQDYILTSDVYNTAKAYTGAYGTPLDVAIVMDHSGSQGDFAWTKSFGSSAKTSITTYLETLSKNVHTGYYRLTCFRKNKHDEVGGVSGYLFNVPMRYYRGQWQAYYLVNCTCNNSYRDQGIYPWDTGYKQCSHNKWISVESAYDQFVADAKTTGYTVGSKYTIKGVTESLYFTIGASKLGKCQDAIEKFLIKLYNSTGNLKPGENHTVSVIGYGASVYIDGYPYNDGNGRYKTENNYSMASKASQSLSDSTYESILKVINDPLTYGASRTDCAFQILSGTLSDIESAAGKSSPTVAATDYLPASKAGRKRVVVLLSDGIACSNLEFTPSVANKAVKASAVLKKDSNTTVYCIGIMNGLDASVQTIYNDTTSQVKMANDFLNAMSSRYKGAQVWNTDGTLTKGNFYFSDTDGGSNIASQMTSVWSGSAAILDSSANAGPASLWLYEDFCREWKPDSSANLKIWAAPYTGNGAFGEEVLIGTHLIKDGSVAQTYTGNGYKLHITPKEDGGYTCALQWTDARTAFLRETALSNGSKAKAISGTLNTSKGYKIFMEVPVTLNWDRTLGGNGIYLTTEASGCYQAAGTTDTAIGAKISGYEPLFANTDIPFYMDIGGDYEIPLEDYQNILNGNIDNDIEFVLSYIVDTIWDFPIVDDLGHSLTDHVNFDIRITAEDGTVLHVRSMDFGDTEWREYVNNIVDGIIDLSKDQTFTGQFYVEFFQHLGKDSFGKAPYEDIDQVMTFRYIVPELPEEPTEPEPTVPSEPEPTEPEPTEPEPTEPEPTEPEPTEPEPTEPEPTEPEPTEPEPTEPEPTEPEPTEPEPTEPTEVPELKPGHSLNLQSDISINYLVSVDILKEYDSYTLVCYVGEDTFTLEGEITDGYVHFTLDGLNALRMNEIVRAVLTAYKGDEVFVSPLDEYSIAKYAYNMMSRDAVPLQFKKLCANLLRYGAASQLYKGYQVDQLPDANLTEEQKTYLRDLDSVEFENQFEILNDYTSPAVTWHGKTLTLDSTITIKFLVNTLGYEGDPNDLRLRVSYTNIRGEEEVYYVAPTVYNAESGAYFFIIDQLDASELRSVLTCQIFGGKEAVSQTLIYSGDSYGIGKTDSLLTLCKALFAYVDEAKTFFGG